MSIRLTLADAQHRYFLSKFPYGEALIKNIDQTLVSAAAFNIASPLTSQVMGRPLSVNCYIKVSAACNVTISLVSASGVVYTLQVVNFTGAGAKAINVVGAPQIQFSTDTNLATATIEVQANY